MEKPCITVKQLREFLAAVPDDTEVWIDADEAGCFGISVTEYGPEIVIDGSGEDSAIWAVVLS